MSSKKKKAMKTRTAPSRAKKYAPLPMTEIAKRALARGPLTYVRQGDGIPSWKYRERLFSHQTIVKLIDAGLAVRDGNVVRRAD